MVANDFLFYIPAFILVASALCVVFVRNPIYGVLALILAFFNAAALFLILGAEFIAMVLIIVYVGAVAVLFLFVVMMLDIEGAISRARLSQYFPLGLLIALILFFEILFFVRISLQEQSHVVIQQAQGLTNTEALGRLLYTDYMPLFEIAALVLLVALVGAIMLMNSKRPRKRQDILKQTDPARGQSVQLKKIKSRSGLK